MPHPVTRRVGPGPVGGIGSDIAPGISVTFGTGPADGGEARHTPSGERHDPTIEMTIEWGRKSQTTRRRPLTRPVHPMQWGRSKNDVVAGRDPAGVPAPDRRGHRAGCADHR